MAAAAEVTPMGGAMDAFDTWLAVIEAGGPPPPRPADDSVQPWAAARPLVRWFYDVGAVEGCAAVGVLPPGRLDRLCDAVFAQFAESSTAWTWSSYMIAMALRAVAACAHGPPEAFVRALWRAVEGRAVDENLYNFVREYSAQLVSRYRGVSGWDLSWMRVPCSDARALVRVFTLAVAPRAGDEALGDADWRRLRHHAFV